LREAEEEAEREGREEERGEEEDVGASGGACAPFFGLLALCVWRGLRLFPAERFFPPPIV
jgi:hypothetical protein